MLGHSSCWEVQELSLEQGRPSQTSIQHSSACLWTGSGYRPGWHRPQHLLVLTRARTRCGLHLVGLGCNNPQARVEHGQAMPGWTEAPAGTHKTWGWEMGLVGEL